jgi:hypothetical protein
MSMPTSCVSRRWRPPRSNRTFSSCGTSSGMTGEKCSRRDGSDRPRSGSHPGSSWCRRLSTSGEVDPDERRCSIAVEDLVRAQLSPAGGAGREAPGPTDARGGPVRPHPGAQAERYARTIPAVGSQRLTHASICLFSFHLLRCRLPSPAASLGRTTQCARAQIGIPSGTFH